MGGIDIPAWAGWIIALLALLWAVYTYLEANKKERLGEKIKAVTDVYDGRFKESEKGILQGETDHVALEKRVRKLESIQITEQRVQTMLKDRVEPVEAAVTKLEDKIERNHRELSTELQISTRETSAQLAKLIETVSFMYGAMEGRRKNDNSN